MNRVKIFMAFITAWTLAAALASCSYLGIESAYPNDPLTGGVSTGTSSLLNVPLPRGLQIYSSHGFRRDTSAGLEGLETLRGHMDAWDAASSLFNTLKSHGWQLRMSVRKGARIVCLYQKNSEYALLAFHPQGMLTILEIWLSPLLPDGATLSLPEETGDEVPSIGSEEYGPLENGGQSSTPDENGLVETWGPKSAIEEREL